MSALGRVSKFQRRFKEVLRVFKGCLKKVSNVFHECFKEVLFCNSIVAWISLQLPEQKEGLFGWGGECGG